MNRTAGFVLVLSLLAGLSACSLESPDTDDDIAGDEFDEDGRVDGIQQLVEGRLAVTLPEQTQKLAGIRTKPAENIMLEAEDRAFASVIGIKDLLKRRSVYRKVAAERAVIQTSLNNSKKILDRLVMLHEEAGNISTSELQKARSQWEANQAKVAALDIELENIRSAMVQNWNLTLAQLALEKDSTIFERLLSQEEFLVLVSLKAGQRLSADEAFVFVGRDDNRAQARKAYLVSDAPFSDDILQGETFFFRTHAEGLRIGMRLYVWLPGTGFSGEGVNIPTESIIWYAGKPWAYVKLDEQTFERRNLVEPVQVDGTWLVRENFSIGEQLVVSGAQTLLSEEFKFAIPDEDDD